MVPGCAQARTKDKKAVALMRAFLKGGWSPAVEATARSGLDHRERSA
jgi:hypothetical protein